MATEISISQEFRDEIEILKEKEQDLRETLANTVGQRIALERMLERLATKAQRMADEKAQRGKETGTSS